MKIAFFELEDWEKRCVQEKFKVHKLIFIDKPLTIANAGLVSDCEVLAVFVYSKIDKNLLSKFRKVRLITTMSTGFDHIDLKECSKKKITVCNVPAYGDNTVAEHTFALILAICRKLIPSLERTRKGNFDIEGLRGFDLKGKTIGVVGTGRIGSWVVRIAHGFGMKIIAYDPFPNKDLIKNYGCVYFKNVENVLKQSDIITLHVPLSDKTKYLINENNISKVKKGAVLINTARGAIVKTSALLKALKNKTIAYAGLDVLEEECFIREEKQLLSDAFKKECDLTTALQEHILLEMDNVLITPHNAFNSDEALQRIIDTTVDNIKSFISGRKINVVNKK